MDFLEFPQLQDSFGPNGAPVLSNEGESHLEFPQLRDSPGPVEGQVLIFDEDEAVPGDLDWDADGHDDDDDRDDEAVLPEGSLPVPGGRDAFLGEDDADLGMDLSEMLGVPDGNPQTSRSKMDRCKKARLLLLEVAFRGPLTWHGNFSRRRLNKIRRTLQMSKH